MESHSCIYHPQNQGLAFCKRCNVYICKDCIIVVDDRKWCKKCYDDYKKRNLSAQKACINHPNNAGISHCKKCGGYLCQACVLVIGEKQLCKKCYNEYQKTKSNQFEISLSKMCMNHSENQGLAFCKRCNGYICTECIIVVGEKKWCKKCYKNNPANKSIKTSDTMAIKDKSSLVFIKEVAKYFMDFLETDFHKRKNPKRSIQFRSSNNLLIGLNLNKYPSFNNHVVKAISRAFDKNALITIPKGVYRTDIPKNLLDIVRMQTEKITGKEIFKILKLIADEVERLAILYKSEFDQALNSSLESTAKILKTNLVMHFITSIEKPIENLNLGDENNIYLMEEELTSVLSSMLENKISDVLKLILSKNKVDTSKQLMEVFDLQDVQLSIRLFFEGFQVGDLFTELYEMERNRTILDKQEFYLYFCDIALKNVKFPIFYIPFEIEKQNDKLTLEFDSQVYINKKALEYITQEYNQANGKKGNLRTISERIIYLAQNQNNFRNLIGDILSEITNFFELDKSVDINNSEKQVSKSVMIRVSNTCYLALFDKSDEALVNDYEEILKLLNAGDSALAEAFNKLIDDFIYKNPYPFNPSVEDEWDNTETNDRLVFNSPIPLNSEQLQILSAIRKHDCKYIIVEGPPGTGKSHTITAIVFDSILKNQSVLVLSDKKEALDVVEDKITETMNKVRLDKNFQNPILRLGKTGSTYDQILATSAVENIKTHCGAVKRDYDSLESTIQKLGNTLKDDLQAEILAYEEIKMKEINELLDLESGYINQGFPLDIDEVLAQTESAIELNEFRRIFLSLKDKLIIVKENKETHFFELLNFSINDFQDIPTFQKYLWLLNYLSSSVAKIKTTYKDELPTLLKFSSFTDSSLDKLGSLIIAYEKEKQWLLGYLLKRKKIRVLDNEFIRSFNLPTRFEAHKNLIEIGIVFDIYKFAEELKSKLTLNGEYQINFDFLRFIHQSIIDDGLLTILNSLIQVDNDLKYLNANLRKYPNSLRKLRIDLSSFKTFCTNELVKIHNLNFDRLIRFINLKQKILKDFNSIPELNYSNQKKQLEDMVTLQMTFEMDKRFINFYEYNQNDAITLKKIIKSKTQFPRDKFEKMKEAFPCILAGIRDYAEYIPLEPEIFDLVIIDEASQVSIAQAFPALLRAKKILILGDNKQFSNIKSAQARSDVNREYLNNLQDCFQKYVSTGISETERLKKFNIRTSILDFFEHISNYKTLLRKHFRGYKEIISYSNKYFYKGELQVMKIRGKPIDEVIKFSFVQHDEKKELAQNSNSIEVNFIISELKKLKEIDCNQTVGIITPHTNQQKLLVELISKTPEKDFYYDKLKLKIMTFDTCQGEEREIVFYSMVATEDNDHLWGVFIKDLNNVDIEEDGKIKAQRLNVGLSRAKETVHFVLSKSIDKYNGSIGEALRHFYFILNESKKERPVSETDKNSKMEREVMNWFYQTDFYNKNKENIEFIPQFELGKYLKQLDKAYNHPDYKVDFLLLFKDQTQKAHKIIIEYDGFREHFKDADDINELNYQNYYTDADVYRQKVLESYGSKFLRINKFNMGKDPISTLNVRILDLIKHDNIKNNLLNNIRETVEGLQNGEMKECPKCKKIQKSEDFKDSSLITGYGRFCKYCKGYDKILMQERELLRLRSELELLKSQTTKFA